MSATQTVPAVVPAAPGRRPSRGPSRGPTKAHKNANFVLEMPENEDSEGQKSTKTSILCSKCPKTGVPEGKSAQKSRFCAREEGDWHQGERKLASGSATAETFTLPANHRARF